MQIACHCLSCKKWSGSAFGCRTWFSRSSFALVSDKIKEYEDSKTDSGRTVKHYFCGECGSSIYNTAAHRPDVVAITIGTMDGIVGETLPAAEEERLGGVKPQHEVYCKRKTPWVEFTTSMQKHQEMPSARPVKAEGGMRTDRL